MNSTDHLQDAPNTTLLPEPHFLGGNHTARQADPQGLTHLATLVTCTFLLAVIFCLGSYGNFIVFLSFFDPAFRKFRTNFDFMILNLSFCDLFICGVTAPMFTFVLFFSSVSSIPDAFCFTFHLTSSGFLLMSLKTVAVIALHRLRMVLGKQPNHLASFPCTLLLTVLLWATSFTLATLATLKTSKSHLCLPMASLIAGEGKAILSLYVVDFTFCVAVVSVSYIMIAQTLWKNAQVRTCPPVITVDASRPQPFVGAPVKGGGDPAHCTMPALYRNQNYNKLQHAQTHGYTKSPNLLPTPAASRLQLVSAVNLSTAKDSRAVVTCVIIVLSVLVCCLPLGISLVQVVLSRSGSFVLYQFELFGFTLIFFKSGLNPFIYSRNSAGLRRKVLWCLQYVGLGFFCCKQKTRLRAVGKGNLEVNRNKSSHHETNSAYMLSPKPQKKFVDQACGPSQSKESVVSPRLSAGHQHCGRSSSTPVNTRMEPYYSVYNSSPSQEESAPCRSQPKDAEKQEETAPWLWSPGSLRTVLLAKLQKRVLRKSNSETSKKEMVEIQPESSLMTAGAKRGVPNPWLFEEPEETRGLGFDKMRPQQQKIIQGQDTGLDTLSSVISCQKQMRREAENELHEQNEMIDDLANLAEKTDE